VALATKTTASKGSALSKAQKTRIVEMARSGKSIVEISKKSGLDYPVVQTCLWQAGTLPWQGAKTVISRRLRSLRSATRRERRDALVEEVAQQVNYLYYAARQLQSRLEKVKRTVG